MEPEQQDHSVSSKEAPGTSYALNEVVSRPQEESVAATTADAEGATVTDTVRATTAEAVSSTTNDDGTSGRDDRAVQATISPQIYTAGDNRSTNECQQIATGAIYVEDDQMEHPIEGATADDGTSATSRTSISHTSRVDGTVEPALSAAPGNAPASLPDDPVRNVEERGRPRLAEAAAASSNAGSVLSSVADTVQPSSMVVPGGTSGVAINGGATTAETGSTFVNQGLARWEEARATWLGRRNDGADSSAPRAAAKSLDVDEIIDLLFAAPKPGVGDGGPRMFPHPIALPQMIDLLTDLWEAEGLDM